MQASHHHLQRAFSGLAVSQQASSHSPYASQSRKAKPRLDSGASDCSDDSWGQTPPVSGTASPASARAAPMSPHLEAPVAGTAVQQQAQQAEQAAAGDSGGKISLARTHTLDDGFAGGAEASDDMLDDLTGGSGAALALLPSMSEVLLESGLMDEVFLNRVVQSIFFSFLFLFSLSMLGVGLPASGLVVKGGLVVVGRGG